MKLEASSSTDLGIFEDMAAGKYMVGDKVIQIQTHS